MNTKPKRTCRKELLFFTTELDTIRQAARKAGLNAGEWVRYLALLESQKFLNEKENLHR